jgi:zinc resistance-associated protein
MRKSFRVAIAALALSYAPCALAQDAEPFSRPQRFSAQDLSAFADARIAALKAGLQLKPEQEKNWASLESAMRDIAKARIARVEEWREDPPAKFDVDPLGALQRRAKNLNLRAGELEKLAAAGKPLYDTLDEAQKRRFGALIRVAIEDHMRGPHGMHGPHGGPGGMDHGGMDHGGGPAPR